MTEQAKKAQENILNIYSHVLEDSTKDAVVLKQEEANVFVIILNPNADDRWVQAWNYIKEDIERRLSL